MSFKMMDNNSGFSVKPSASAQNTDRLNTNKPEILRHVKTKLFVLLLCVLSFFAGWQASRSYLVKECHLVGAQVTIKDKLILCQMPQFVN